MCHTSHSRLVVSSDLVGRLVADIQQTPDGVRLEGVLDGRSVSDARTALNDALEAVTGDVTDPTVMTSLLARRFDVIFHLASIVSGEAEADFDKGWQINGLAF